MKNQVLSIEQMKHLKIFGVGISLDCRFLNWGKWDGKDILSSGITGIGICRAFTLYDILEKLPKEIHPMPIDSIVFTWVLESNVLAYRNVDDYADCLHSCRCATLIESAYKMLCWCAENGYMKGDKE